MDGNTRIAMAQALSRRTGLSQRDLADMLGRVLRHAPPGFGDDTAQDFAVSLLDARPTTGAAAYVICKRRVCDSWRVWRRGKPDDDRMAEYADKERAMVDAFADVTASIAKTGRRYKTAVRERDAEIERLRKAKRSIVARLEREALVTGITYELGFASNCDAKTAIRMLPPNVRTIVQSRINGERLPDADRKALERFRKSDAGRNVYEVLALR